MKHYEKYVWENGAPYGILEIEDIKNYTGVSYKVPSDPYRKRLSVEKYENGRFVKTIYDSALLDFRKLDPVNQATWERVVISENDDQMVALVKDQDDRAVIFEKHHFEEGVCRMCEISSIHDIAIGRQKISHKALKDSFDGVVLYDDADNPVVKKTYQTDDTGLQFTTLINEDWKLYTR